MPHALARRRRIRREPLVSIAPESGRAFTARTGRPELSSHERPSPAVVLENGRPLGGPANALHEDIRRAGAGRYSFWHDHVYFAASDGSDPRTNGRRYEIAFGVGAVRGALTVSQARRLLGIESRYEMDGFLKAHGVFLDLSMEDVRRDSEAALAPTRR